MNEKLPEVKGYEKELAKAATKYRKGEISDTSYDEIKARLEPLIEEGHSYQFVGRVGLFCPIIGGHGGGELVRKQDNKFYAVTGTKKRDGTPYRWLETELVEKVGMQEYIDISYYENLVEEAENAIGKYIRVRDFLEEDFLAPYMNIPEGSEEEVPFHA